MKIKYIAIVLLITIVGLSFGLGAKAQTQAEIQAMIDEITKAISDLVRDIAELQATPVTDELPPSSTTCTSFTYTDWSACVSGTKIRTVLTSLPSGCTGGTPVTSQSCTVTPPPPTTCTSFTYTDWGACVNSVRTRTVLTSLPLGCTGGAPILSETCTATPSCVGYLNNSVVVNSLQPMTGSLYFNLTNTTNSTQTISISIGSGTVSQPTISVPNSACSSPANITYSSTSNTTITFTNQGRVIASIVVSANTTPVQPTTCTSFTYTDWGSCVNSVKTRTVLTSLPSGCTGGSPVLSETCTVTPPPVVPLAKKSYSVVFTPTPATSTTYTHTMNVTTSTGYFISGTGFYNPSSATTWSFTGSQNGSNVSFQMIYTGQNAGYILNATGTINSDGTMSGTASNTARTQNFTWTATPTTSVTPPPCTPSWQTSAWGTCNNGNQIRVVTDLNNCGTMTGRPITTQPCGSTGQYIPPCMTFNNVPRVTAAPTATGTLNLTDYCSADGQSYNRYDCDSSDPKGYTLKNIACLDGCVNGACKQLPAPKAMIVVNYPNGGETLQKGTTYNITWYSQEFIKFNLGLVDEGGRLNYFASDITPSRIRDGKYNAYLYTYSWTPTTAGRYKINISWMSPLTQSAGVSANSDAFFTVIDSSVVMPCTPNWQLGAWGTCTTGTQIRTVTDANNCGITTNKPATVQNCSLTSITITSPSGGENWKVGETHDITWTYSGFSQTELDSLIRITIYSEDGKEVCAIDRMDTKIKDSRKAFLVTKCRNNFGYDNDIVPGRYMVKVMTFPTGKWTEAQGAGYFTISPAISTPAAVRLSVAIDPSTPRATTFTTPQTGITFSKITITNDSDFIVKIKGMKIGTPQGTTQEIELHNIKILDGSTQIVEFDNAISALQKFYDSYYNFISLPSLLTIPAHGSKTLTIVGNLKIGSTSIGILELYTDGVENVSTGLPIFGNVMTVPSVTNNTCVDSDNGKNYETAGGITTNLVKINDYCSGQYVYEYFCDPINSRGFSYVPYACPNWCSNGACIKSGTIITPPTNGPFITVTSPNGGERWQLSTYAKTQTYNITWNSSGVEKVSIRVVCGDFSATLASSIQNKGYYTWNGGLDRLPKMPCRIEVSEMPGTNTVGRNLVGDNSNGDFVFYGDPTATVISPNGGENWVIGTMQTIKYSTTEINPVGMCIEADAIDMNGNAASELYSGPYAGDWSYISASGRQTGLGSGSTFRFVATDYMKPGSYKLLLQVYKCTEKTRDNLFSIARGLSANYFNVLAEGATTTPTLTINSPKNSTCTVGQACNITWTSSGVSNLKIDVMVGSNRSTIATSVAASQGSYVWTIPSTAVPGAYALILVSDTGATTATSIFTVATASTTSTVKPLSVTLDSSSPTATTFSSAQTNLTFAKIKIANNSDTNITNLSSIQIATPQGTTVAPGIVNIKIYDGSTLLGSMAELIGYQDFYYTWIPVPTTFVIPARGSKTLTVSADFKNGSTKLGIIGFYPASVKDASTGLPIFGQTMTITPTAANAGIGSAQTIASLSAAVQNIFLQIQNLLNKK